MAKDIFTTILDSGRGNTLAAPKKARSWYRDRAIRVRRNAKGTRPNQLIREAEKKKRLKTTIKGKLMIGNMYMFQYRAKLEETLPYYDQFPLVFPFQPLADGFIGINMHYISPKYRAILMDKLYPLLRNKKMDETTRLRLSYEILNGSRKYKYFRPCIHRYLTEQVESRFIKVPVKEWDIALFLPTQRFVGEKSRKIWAESRRQFT